MEKSDKQIKKEHFQNLVAIAYADGVLKKKELLMLSQRAEEYGLGKEVVEEVMANADKFQFLIPMNDEEREEQLSDAVYMAMVDGEVDKTEFDLCLKIAEKLDLDESYLNHVIELTRKLWK